MGASGAGARSPHVLLGVTGCIAAYKAPEVVRGLQKAGCEVRVAMTEAASRFIGKATFEGLCGAPVLDDLFCWAPSAIPHIELGEWADLAVVCPCTANVAAKLTAGLADDALTSAFLATPAPVCVVPAMNVHMWKNPATQANVQTLRSRGVDVMAPDTGRLACGDVGEGKLPSVEAILAHLLARPELAPAGPLSGRRVLVTAGPTHEAIDPVRFIANASSGKMGYELARAARAAGAQVTVVSGPVSLPEPPGVEVVPIVSAADLHREVMARAPEADLVVCAAAVADYTPAAPADHKLKKGVEPLDTVRLVPTADVLAQVSALPGTRCVVGFAAETDDLLANARAKLRRKGCSMIVANDVSRADSTFGSDTDAVTLVLADGEEELPLMPKADVARAVIDRACRLMA